GKEFQDELGLNWTAMDFRNYDAALGRFMSPDPLAELFQEWTTYKFAYNNPVYWRDPSGLFEQTFDGWVRGEDGTVEWDPNVNDQRDVDRLHPGSTYVPDGTIEITPDGRTVVYNPDGTKSDAVGLDEARIKPKTTAEHVKKFLKDQVSPIIEGTQVVGGTLINGLYGIGAALVITIDEATWTEPADELMVRMRLRNLQPLIPMKIYGFRNGRWDY